MSGNGIAIVGELAPDRLESIPAAKPWFARLLRRTEASRGAWRNIGTTWFIEPPSNDLAPLFDDYRRFLDDRFPQPWPATRQLLEYLDSGVADVRLRGERGADQTVDEARWRIDLVFSGCAGVGEVSAAVAAHWAGHWYKRRRDAIADRLTQAAGFTPHGLDEGLPVTGRFLPLEGGYYALYHDEPQPGFTAAGEIETHFEIDEAVLEDPLVDGDPLPAIEAHHAARMADGRCRCQLCAPDGLPGYAP